MNSLSDHIRKETRNNIVINLVLNAVIAFLIFRSQDAILAWSSEGFGKDLLITGFLLCALLGGIFVGMSRRAHRKEPFDTTGVQPALASKLLPHNAYLSAILFGVCGLLIAAPALILVLKLAGIESLSPIAYAILKGVWAAALAAVVVPIAVKHGVLNRVVGPENI